MKGERDQMGLALLATPEDQEREFRELLAALGVEPNQKPTSIWRRWWRWHCEHPEVMDYLVKLVREVKRRGFKRYGMQSLFERLRWHFHIEKGIEDFKLNNDFASRYARALMKHRPELEGFFEVRALKAE